jgi:hypothetical protein
MDLRAYRGIRETWDTREIGVFKDPRAYRGLPAHRVLGESREILVPPAHRGIKDTRGQLGVLEAKAHGDIKGCRVLVTVTANVRG